MSDWLLEHPPGPGDYPLGLSWRVPEEIPPQHALLLELIGALSGEPGMNADTRSMDRLRTWLRALPVTGRVSVSVADARWLQANPARDPVLRANHTVAMPKRPRTVTVITDSGARCQVAHTEGVEVIAYIEACGEGRVDWAWIAQPDGRIQRYGVAIWNEQVQDLPAPGAWIWAPARGDRWPERFSERLIIFLATQGPAQDGLPGAAVLPGPDATPKPLPPGSVSAPFSISSLPALGSEDAGVRSVAVPPGLQARGARSRDLLLSENDWGLTGLLQTPTARTPEAGHFNFNMSRVYPYVRGNIFASPFDWFEGGLRYTNVVNRLYGPADFSGTQAYKDKGFDAKFRVWKESAYLPQVAVGVQDLAGTGLFSGEYVVASKRTGPLDWSLGMGWGYVGARGDMRNPLSRIDSKFDTRTAAGGLGGNFAFGSYFRGPVSLFGGVQYQTPIERLILKLEYDGNDYQHEPLGNVQPQRSPYNFGVLYRYSRAVDITAGVERGNTFMVGFSLRTQLDGLSMPKISDPPPVPVLPFRPQTSRDWSVTSRDIAARTGWNVRQVEQQGRELRVLVDALGAVYWHDRLDKAVSVLHRDAPATVDRFVIAYQQAGIRDTEHVVDRDAWSTPMSQPLPPREQREPVVARAAQSAGRGLALYDKPGERFSGDVGLGYQQTLGGPEGFILYQLSAVAGARFNLRDDTWLQGAYRVGLIDNYDKFRITGPSNLPRVRTFLREYVTTSNRTMPSLQISHLGRLSENQFYSLYGGYLEPMFAGYGAEWMYRPRSSRVAYGVDVNQVQQRGFRQDFELRDYRVATGHATVYWDTGWNDVVVATSFGRYLAGDKGATLQLTKLFNNGVSVGAFATRTNVSAEQFGEGSFDKGIFISVPFDAILTRSSRSFASVLYRPVTRDGGQKLHRAVQLYDFTGLRSERALEYRPAPDPNDYRIPADRQEPWKPRMSRPAAFTQVLPKPAGGDVPAELQTRLEAMLYAQGFRNIGISFDSSRRLTLRVSSVRLAPVSRAVGRAARSGIAVSPLDTRELRVVFSDDGQPAATYDFADALRLQQFFAGELSREQFRKYVSVQYHNAVLAEADPLAFLDEVAPGEQAPVLAPLPGAPLANRVWSDMKQAGRTASQADWLKAGALGIGLVAGSAFFDERAFRYARRFERERWAREATRVGNKIPLVALGGAGLAMFASSDPALSRTGYAAAEAGGLAYLAATGLKMLAGRLRPAEGASPRDFQRFSTETNRDSFPSRHTAVAWAAITPFAIHYDAPWLYGAAALTQLGRVTSREHWFSDTVAGSVLGAALGQIFYHGTRTTTTRGQPRVFVVPSGAMLAWEFN